MQGEWALEVEGLTVSYGSQVVLRNMSFTIPRGKRVAILGPNGAGKSSFLQAILGFLPPISGKIRFFGKSYQEARSSLAYLPQKSAVDWDFPISVLDVVCMGSYGRLGLFKRLSTKEKALAHEAIAAVGLSDLAGRQIGELSGGQKQRVFFARALLQQAELYFMDEPFAGVDATTEKVLFSVIEKMQSEGKTIFVVHHDLQSVEGNFDYVLFLRGALVDCGPTATVFHKANLQKTYGDAYVCTL